MTPPTSGPPIGVEPWKATNHSDITRPRISGSAVSWSVELPVDMNEMLAPPTSASANSSKPSVGATVARHRDAEAGGGDHQRSQPGPAARCDEQAADHRADAHRGGHEAKAGGADVEAAVGHDRQRDLELVGQAAGDGHHQQRHGERRRRARRSAGPRAAGPGRGASGGLGESAARSMRHQRGDHRDEAGRR